MKIHSLTLFIATICTIISCRKDSVIDSCNYDSINLSFDDQIFDYNADGTLNYITTNDTSSFSLYGSDYISYNYNNGQISRLYKRYANGEYFNSKYYYWSGDNCTSYFTQEASFDTTIVSFRVDNKMRIISSSKYQYYLNTNFDIDSIVPLYPSNNIKTVLNYNSSKQLVSAERIIRSGVNTGEIHELKKFIYNDKNQWITCNITYPLAEVSYELNYTYNDHGQLSLLEYNSDVYLVQQNGCGKIINLEPKNFYRFDYLSIPIIGLNW